MLRGDPPVAAGGCGLKQGIGEPVGDGILAGKEIVRLALLPGDAGAAVKTVLAACSSHGLETRELSTGLGTDLEGDAALSLSERAGRNAATALLGRLFLAIFFSRDVPAHPSNFRGDSGRNSGGGRR